MRYTGITMKTWGCMPVNITMEQVEKVRACTQCSYEQAKAALEETGGNVLDAVILLEQKEKRDGAGGDYSTRTGEPVHADPPEWKRPTWKEVRGAAASVVENCLSIFLEVWKGGEMTCRIPLLAAVLLVLIEPYLMVGLLILGLFLGYRVHVSGRGTEGWGPRVNGVVDQVGDTVYDAVRSLRKDKKTQRK